MAMHLGIYLYEAKKQRVMHLNELDEIFQDAIKHKMLVQDKRACWNDQFIKKKISIQDIGLYSLITGLKISRESSMPAG